MVSLEVLPSNLLNGQFLHCRPVENGEIVEARVYEAGEELPLAEKIIVCPERAPMSQCGATGKLCHYWRSRYIIGPQMDKKLG